jgi:putative heme-binding domain-containing protein
MAVSLFSLGIGATADAAEADGQAVAAAHDRPLQALLVTGGCCHDYDRQKRILTRGISGRANVRWTVVHQGGTTTDTPIPLYDDPNWADGFDIVVHNECFSDVKDLDFVDRILQPHRDGTPAILIHCAMHCYRVGDDRWFEFVGLQSPGHGPHYSYTADNLKPDHPIMKGFGPQFVAPKGELYHSARVFDTATPLAQANRQADGEPQVCVWTNDYRGTRVFGCTMGHYNETMAEPAYLDMMARAVLWATGRDVEEGFTPATPELDAEIRGMIDAPVDSTSAANGGNCCGEENLAFEALVTAKSTQGGNPEQHLTDGRLDTRWCADGAQTDEWVMVDLGEPQHLRNIRLHWEQRKRAAYQYTVEGSTDGEAWTMLVDARENKRKKGVVAHTVDAADTRYLRVTFLGCSTGGWGSLWELEASAGELADLVSDGSADGVKGSLADVRLADGFQATVFGAPPAVNYPVCLTAAATGEVFVGVDEQGSLGKEPGRGKVLRCEDTDGDGKADRITEFARMDHPRGLIFDNGSLWVLHPPLLSVYRDHDGDGVADSSEVLIEGISTDEVANRGADHTTNGIRMGVDGWIYIAVGDFGFQHAVGADGTALSRRGGGVVRVRPDGSNMEIYSWGQRNIVDVAIDPLMNLYTRDNTNDGGGWDIRLSHVMQSAHYGYPSLYLNFSEEIMPPLADYGGGSGCGAMFFQDDRWPVPFNNQLLTCDWGRSEVFAHRLPANGATFDAHQEPFITIPRPTDIDADASGRLYVSSWKNGQFNYDGPNIGFVAMVTPIDFVPHPVPEVANLGEMELVDLLRHPADAMRQHVQRELLRRLAADGDHGPTLKRLAALAADASPSRATRVIALWTLRQASWEAFAGSFEQLLADAELTEHVIRAAADEPELVTAQMKAAIRGQLTAGDPRVQAAATVAAGRLSDLEAAPLLLQMASRRQAQHTGPTAGEAAAEQVDDWRLPHPERVIPHLAVQALVAMEAVAPCLDSLAGSDRAGALWALRSLHSAAAVDGLFRMLGTTRDDSLRQDLWTTLIRLVHREGDYTAESPGWWGTRPDTTGPYYDRQEWEESARIKAAVSVALTEAPEPLAAHIREQLARHEVAIDGVGQAVAAMDDLTEPIVIPSFDPSNPAQIGNQGMDAVVAAVLPMEGNADAGRELFRAQACIHCHTYANGQRPKGPHLVDIGKRATTEELLTSILNPGKIIAQGFDTWSFLLDDGRVFTGFVALESAETVTIRQTDGLPQEFPRDAIDERIKQEVSMMPNGIVNNLTPEQLADLVAYLRSLR